METTDYSQAGGFPLSQDRLNDLQRNMITAVGILAKMGGLGAGVAVRLWGMKAGPALYGGGAVGNISDGAFFDNDELCLFTGADYGAISDAILVKIDVAATPLTYHDGSTPGVLLNKTATFEDAPAITDATHFPYGDMVLFAEAFSENSREITTQHIVVGSGTVTGNIYYRLEPLINSLHLWFEVSPTAPTGLPLTSTRIEIGTLQAGFRPPFDRYVPVSCYDETVGSNDNGDCDLRFSNLYINSGNGKMYLGMSKHTGGTYERYVFNGFIPLYG